MSVVDTFKKIMQFLSSILFYTIMLFLLIIVIMFLSYFVDQKIGASKGEIRNPLFGAYIIISESMIPSINVYDAVVTMRVNEDNIKIDDIITFISKEIQTAGTPITHRVIGIVHDESGEKILGYRTKGDNNNTADFALIAPNEVIGKVMLRIPLIGYLQTLMTKPIGWILIVVIPCLFIIGSDVLKLVSAKKKDDEVIQQENIIVSQTNIPNNESINNSNIIDQNINNNINSNINFNNNIDNNTNNINNNDYDSNNDII